MVALLSSLYCMVFIKIPYTVDPILNSDHLYTLRF